MTDVIWLRSCGCKGCCYGKKTFVITIGVRGKAFNEIGWYYMLCCQDYFYSESYNFIKKRSCQISCDCKQTNGICTWHYLGFHYDDCHFWNQSSAEAAAVDDVVKNCVPDFVPHTVTTKVLLLLDILSQLLQLRVNILS